MAFAVYGKALVEQRLARCFSGDPLIRIAVIPSISPLHLNSPLFRGKDEIAHPLASVKGEGKNTRELKWSTLAVMSCCRLQSLA